MESLYFLVPCALIFIGLAIKVMFWAINNGQYDNLDTEAHRILFDADKKPGSQTSQDQTPSQDALPGQDQGQPDASSDIPTTSADKNPHA
jgi:cbb3-type cytochrome oxidase maturation protein